LQNWSNGVANKQYIERIQMVIAQLHGCDSKHVESVPVHEVFRGKTVWDGIVEVFDLVGHPKAKRCYAWSHPEGTDDKGERFVTVLELPPVVSPKTAVQVAAVNDIKKRYDHRRQHG
jgi:hypothetical protein